MTDKMKAMRGRMIGVLITVLAAAGLMASAVGAVAKPKSLTPADYSSIGSSVAKVQLPAIPRPAWLTKQIADEAAAKLAAQRKAANTVVVTYEVTTKGLITSNVAEFQQHANATLNDIRGWARMNVVFRQVAGGGMFTLVLAEASQVPTYSSGCSSEYSCRAGRYVIINQTRWQQATPSWNQAGGSLRDYQHMVINHEVGHWLGHDHRSCGASGQPAPVMQQQSMDLQGCSFNPWPLASELYAPQIGVQ